MRRSQTFLLWLSAEIKKDKVKVYSSWQANNQFSAHKLTRTSVICFHMTNKYDKYEKRDKTNVCSESNLVRILRELSGQAILWCQLLSICFYISQSRGLEKLGHQGAICWLKKELSMVHGTLNIFQE